MARTRERKRPMAEMNVVPYIDVMLVLLVIFMITAPMLTQGINVDLPQASSEPIKTEDIEPLVASVDKAGAYYLNIGGKPNEPIDEEALVQKVAAVLRLKPQTPVLVRGDQDVNYGKVVTLMALLQQAGAPNVGMLTQPVENKR